MTSDRYSAYAHLPAEPSQACWVHLRRDFQTMLDRDAAGSTISEDLLVYFVILFGSWSKVRAGTASLRTFAK